MNLAGKSISGLLIDLDGVLYVDGTAIPGAVPFVRRLRDQSIPHCFLTNTTTRSVAAMKQKLAGLGFEVDAPTILSAPEAARTYLKQRGHHRCQLLLNPDVKKDFSEVEECDSKAEAVVIGDIGNAWTYDLLNRVFRSVMDGAELIALHRNKFWQTDGGLQMDIGAFVAGLEYVTGKPATIIGKPAAAFFDAALARLQLKPGSVAMIGDDIDTDVGAAQAAGLCGVLVRTGKFREDYFRASGVKPDLVIDSIGDFPW